MKKPPKQKPRPLTVAERDRLFRLRSSWQQNQARQPRATAEGRG